MQILLVIVFIQATNYAAWHNQPGPSGGYYSDEATDNFDINLHYKAT